MCSCTSCEGVNSIAQPLFQELVYDPISAVFTALRTYAIGGRDWRPALLVFALAVVPVGTNLYSDVNTWFTALFLPPLGIVCDGNQNVTVDTGNKLLIATRACAIASDLLALAITWSSTYQIKRDADKAKIKASLATLLLRDGTLYFVILLALNAMHMGFYLTNTFVDISWFIVPISSSLISRFLLNLRQVYHPSKDDQSRPSFVRSAYNTQSQMSDLRFASTFIGNMGAPLHYGSVTTTSDMERTTDLSSSSGIDVSFSSLDCLGHEADSGQSIKERPLVSREPLRVGLDLQDAEIQLNDV